MSIDRISQSAPAPAASIGSSSIGSASIGSAPTPGHAAGLAARAAAVTVVGQLAGHFMDAATQWPSGESRPYALAEIAEALGARLGASPLETMELEGALATLAGSLAADMAALADGRTLDRLDAALAELGENPALAEPGTVARHLEDLASHVAQAR